MSDNNEKYWRLGDAQAQGNVVLQDGDSQPSTETVEPIEKGSNAKLLFVFNSDDPNIPDSEQIWVELLLVQDGKFLGQIKHDSMYIKDLRQGEIIEFEECNIVEFDYINPMNLMKKSN